LILCLDHRKQQRIKWEICFG